MRHGIHLDLWPHQRRPKVERPCAVAGCEATGPRFRGMCKRHYQRWWKTDRVARGLPVRRRK